MKDMCSYFIKWREWRNEDLGIKLSMSIKGAREDGKNDSQSIDQSIKNSINRFNVKLFQQTLAFQQAFSNFSILFPSCKQVFGKFPIVLFHSFVVKSNIVFSNSSILVASSIQVFINFLPRYCFHSKI